MKSSTSTKTAFVSLLDKLYELSLSGFKCIESAEQLAVYYQEHFGSTKEQIDALIKKECTKSAVSGFLLGLGSFITLPITLPSNVVTALFVQMRLVLTIAILCKVDMNHPALRLMIKLAICGKSGRLKLAKYGSALLTSPTTSLLTHLEKQLLINVTKEQGIKQVVKLGRYMPLIGGIIGATVDGSSTYLIGQQAKSIFY